MIRFLLIFFFFNFYFNKAKLTWYNYSLKLNSLQFKQKYWFQARQKSKTWSYIHIYNNKCDWTVGLEQEVPLCKQFNVWQQHLLQLLFYGFLPTVSFFQSFCNSPRGMNLKTANCIFFGNCSPESYSMLDTKLWELKVVKRRSKTLREWTKETGALVRGEDWNVRQSVYNLDIYFRGTETIAIQTL